MTGEALAQGPALGDLPETAPDLEGLLRSIRQARRSATRERALLVAISGIDGSGKGFVAAGLDSALRAGGLRSGALGVDGWLNLPLRDWRSVSIEADAALRLGQEGLPPAEATRAYETIYFPAQRIHMEQDDPRGAADLVVRNDRSYR